MESLLGILSLCALFLILILIMAVLIVIEIKKWGVKRDEYYNQQMKELRNEFAEIKKQIVETLKKI